MSPEFEDKQLLIDRFAERAEELAAGQDFTLVEPFARQCCEELSFEELEGADSGDLARAIFQLFALGQRRRAGELLLEVFNPDAENDGWGADRTVIQFVIDDMPFLVDSVTGEVARRELTVHRAMYPQLQARRDAKGTLLDYVALGSERQESSEEAFVHLEVDRQTSPAVLVDLETALRKVLADVQKAVEDWQPMCQAAARVLEELEQPSPLPEDEIGEIRAFMRWVYEDHFTFLGYLEYRLEADGDAEYLRPLPETGLGLLRELPLGERATSDRPLTSEAVRFLHGDRLVAISKTSSKATVHRSVHMDLISVKHYDDELELAGEYRFLGLFTSMAYSITASEIPLVRRKVARVIGRTGFPPVSHSAKALRHIVENYPRDELFQISEDDLYRFALRTLELQLRPRLALLVRRDEEDRFFSCMVYVPRDLHSTELRVRMQDILEHAFAGEVTAYRTRISDQPMAQLQFIVQPRGADQPEVDVAAVEVRLTEAARTWNDRLKEALGAASGQEAGLEAWRRWGEAFPSAYQEMIPAAEAARDIPILDEVVESGKLGMRLYRREGAVITRYHFRTFELAIPAPLSNFLPILENMGFTVNTESPFEVRPAEVPNPIWIRDFELVAQDLKVDPEDARERFEEAFACVWSGEVENDGFNRLVLRAGLDWRQVVLLRAYYRYLRQIGFAFSQGYVTETLASHPEIVRLLVELFEVYFDPARQAEESGAEESDPGQGVVQRIQGALEGVESRDEDRILWLFLNLIQATLRTNYFQSTLVGRPKDYLSFKLDAERVRELPLPRPWVEVFVYSPWMEAVHLRGGKVARGGIRWSDRREDFRTEILGLLKSQKVKNAVIVPVGAKGGFVVKQPQSQGDRDAAFEEGVVCYKTMIRGLLDLTDNLHGDPSGGTRVAPPPDVVRRDGDDTYLVVAADKGTARFSDIANGVAREYGFWLGDAFASGGSVGYDHKKMAITARGAWESVKRHFREMGRDIQSESFTTVGVGDMSGDVFGNGMLLSKHTRLVAAFNHLHIFVDPDPDPAASFKERRRLFKLPRSTWADYDAKLLSAGGAVYERAAKSVTVSPEVRELLGLTVDDLPPDELIRAVLRAKVDLLWFGGIGTYVKGSAEAHASAGDFTNDDVRVDAAELCCQAIGEGANLGLTQAGRIEFALTGGRINTDFIDNSGGVDCSDHEVNIKIVLDEAVAAGDLEKEKRDRLLGKMSKEVAALVLRDNYLQTQSISITQAQGAGLLDEHVRLMRTLERSGLLDRRLEGLPDETTLAERRESKRGLTRPEIAVLLAYSKIYVLGELLDSQLPDESLLIDDLVGYFPRPMRRRFRAAIERHRLRREIVATRVTNSIINRVGPDFVIRLAEGTGSKIADVARAYIAARDVFAMRSVWEEIESLDNRMPTDQQNRLWLTSVQLIERATRWFLRYGGRPLDITACVDEFEMEIVVVAAQLVDLLAPRSKARVRRRTKRLRELGAPTELATRIASMDILPSACDVARCSRASEVPVERVGRVYFAVGERFGFDRLRYEASRLGGESPWLQAAVTANVEDLSSHQAELARQIVAHPGKARAAIEAWSSERSAAVHRLDSMLEDFEVGRIDLAMLTIAERELRRLVGHDA
ncbi:MAG: NAD-glutamate dehydrogenase [bacterium]|nr:NAD-glutamate dehydrogenase [bacterium]